MLSEEVTVLDLGFCGLALMLEECYIHQLPSTGLERHVKCHVTAILCHFPGLRNAPYRFYFRVVVNRAFR